MRDWFFVMFLFSSSRNGVAAKEVQRQLSVTYKTAWRMCNLIRKYMGYVDGDFPLGGPGKTVEIDETFLGGKDGQATMTRPSCSALSSATATCLPDASKCGPSSISFVRVR